MAAIIAVFHAAATRRPTERQVFGCVWGSYPGDGEGHVEVLAPLQAEAPWGWPGEGHAVIAHVLSKKKKKTLTLRKVRLPDPGFFPTLMRGEKRQGNGGVTGRRDRIPWVTQ